MPGRHKNLQWYFVALLLIAALIAAQSRSAMARPDERLFSNPVYNSALLDGLLEELAQMPASAQPHVYAVLLLRRASEKIDVAIPSAVDIERALSMQLSQNPGVLTNNRLMSAKELGRVARASKGSGGSVPKIYQPEFVEQLANSGLATHAVFVQFEQAEKNTVNRVTRVQSLANNRIVLTVANQIQLPASVLPLSMARITVDQCVINLNAVLCDGRLLSKAKYKMLLRWDSVSLQNNYLQRRGHAFFNVNNDRPSQLQLLPGATEYFSIKFHSNLHDKANVSMRVYIDFTIENTQYRHNSVWIKPYLLGGL